MFAAAIKQPIKQAYEDIRNGDDPWVAVGNFSHDWFGNFTDQRTELVQEPVELLEESTKELRQWAAFCAASVEYLCEQAHMPVPAWVHDAKYVLSEEEAFYTHPLSSKQRIRERLQNEAPEPFKRHNVFCSERVYANKYEAVQPALAQSA
jgi:hypothetical protein